MFQTLHQAIRGGLVRSCHDLSEGGLAVALAEMAFAGGLGLQVNVSAAPHDLPDLSEAQSVAALLFAESNTRFVCEVQPDKQERFESLLGDQGIPFGQLGGVHDGNSVMLQVSAEDGAMRTLADMNINVLKEAWQTPLRWQ